VPVERRVVQLAQDQPFGQDWRSAVSVANDVGRIDEFPAPQAADGAAASVGTQDRLAEAGLMHPRLHDMRVGRASGSKNPDSKSSTSEWLILSY
jgi:hypothetical protein